MSKKLKGNETPEQHMAIRVLCDSRHIGGLIGKGGSTVKQMREESGAHIDIADAVDGAKKRIVTVRGNVDTVANALHLMADKLHSNRSGRNDDGKAGEADEVNIMLLVPQCQIGGVIGKGGAKVNATRESSGANVKISDSTLDDSTEKSVTIKGASEQVYKALILICYHVLENADKTPRQLYWPKPEFEGGGAPAMYGFNGADPSMGYGMGGAGMGQYGGRATNPYASQAGAYGAYGGGAGTSGFGGAGGVASNAATENVVIPIQELLIGYVIGRGGSTINEIRKRSRAQIKIAEKQPGVQERIVTITGTRQANEVAVALMNEKLSHYDVSYAQ